MKVLGLDGLTQLVNKTKELISISTSNSLENAKRYTDDKLKQIDVSYNAAGSDLGLVKSGGDVNISDGIITVNDDSHAHVISNIDGLQSTLDEKALSTHTHNYAGSSSPGGAATSALQCTGNANTSTTLQTSRTIQTNLGSSSSASFNGSTNITPGVTGTLPISNGGTGSTTAANAFSALSKVTSGGYWTTAPIGISAWKYEGNDTKTYSLPNNNCFILVLKESAARGTALAFNWVNEDISMWRNNLHDDSQSNKWVGWTSPSLLTNLSSTSSANPLSNTPRPGVTGTLPVTNGGTGATTAAKALNNLGITYGTTALTPGSSSLTTGSVYLQYE